MRKETQLAFVSAVRASDVPDGSVQVCDLEDREVAICKANGQIYAIDNLCTHDDGPLDQGEIDGFEIECPRHRARFDIRTGEATRGPAIMPVDTYPVRVNGEEIEVEL